MDNIENGVLIIIIGLVLIGTWAVFSLLFPSSWMFGLVLVFLGILFIFHEVGLI